MLIIVFSCIDGQGNNGQGDLPLDVSHYDEGETISLTDQTIEYNYCYPPNDQNQTFNLLDHTGKVFMFELSASW